MEQNKEIWEDCFNIVEVGLRKEPIHYKDNSNLLGEVLLKELYEKSDIDFEEGITTLVDLMAYLIEKGGFVIVKK